jgi:LysM repeat protein
MWTLETRITIMAHLKWLVVLILLVLAGCNLGTAPEATPEQVQPTAAGQPTCDQLVTNALSKANTICASTGRNQACYGNSLVQAEMQPDATTTFNLVGDITDLFSIRRLTTTPINLNSQTWGVVILKAQANLPDTLPGQNVTFLLYGDATLDNITPQMKAVVLKTGIASTTCANAPDSALLLQSPQGAQAALTINGASVTLGSTAYITAQQNSEMEIGTIEGSAVVSAFNTTRIVQPGAKIGMSLAGSDGLQVAGPPSEPEPFDTQLVASAPLTLLERQVQPPPPIAPVATEEVQPVQTVAPACVPRGDWNFTYVVRAGDTLSSIAQSVGLTLSTLQQGNCIGDPNQIQIGQILRVPVLPAPAVPPTSVAPTAVPPTAVPTPTDPNLRADSTIVQQGQCTTIRWDASNVSKVYFEGQPTTGSGSQQVCPRVDTTYTLLVVYLDGKQIPYAIRIQVALPFPTDTPQPIG